MKKIISLILAMLLLLTIICGCNNNDKKKTETGKTSKPSTVESVTSGDNNSSEDTLSSEDATSSEEDTSFDYSTQYPETTPVDNDGYYAEEPTTTTVKVKRPWYYNEYGEELRAGLRAGVSLSFDGEWGQRDLVKDPDATIYNREYYGTIASAGFDHVRIPLGLADANIGEGPDYELDIELCRYWDLAINMALECKLIVIFDNHENNPQNYDKTVKMWEQIAKRYRYYPEELMFSFLTSPNRFVTSDEDLNKLQKRCVEAVRKTNPTRTCILALNNWNKYYTLWNTEVPYLYDDKGKVVTDDKGEKVYDPNIMLAPHHYEPEDFVYQGVNGYPPNQHWGPVYEEKITEVFEFFADYEKRFGRQIWIAECGVSNKNHDASCVDVCLGKWFEYFSKEAARCDISYCLWNFSNGAFAIYDAENENPDFFPYVLKNLTLEW